MTSSMYHFRVLGMLLLITLVYTKTMYLTNVYTHAQFSQSLLKDPHIVLFFAPWCPHTRAFFSTWTEFVSQRSLSAEVKTALVDCTAETELCALQNILAYPTIKFFHPSMARPVRFRGARTVPRIRHFLFDMVARAFEEANRPPQTVPSPDHFRTVVALDASNWERQTERGSFLVKFFAPWCPVCVQMAPKWQQLATGMSDDATYSIAEVNCDVAATLCSTLGVVAYPTVAWFHNGLETARYTGALEVDAMQNFITQCLALNERFDGITTGTVPARVRPVLAVDVHDEAEFLRLLGQHELAFVKFHVPWCRYCRELMPKWTEMGRLLQRDHPNRVGVINVDCVVNRQLCNKVKIRGYPTLVLYRDTRPVEVYRGPRDPSAMVTFLERHFTAEKGAAQKKEEL